MSNIQENIYPKLFTQIAQCEIAHPTRRLGQSQDKNKERETKTDITQWLRQEF